MTELRDTLVVRPERNRQATRTLVCLGFCGGGPGPYFPWAREVPPNVELVAVCYPGRDGRYLEGFAANWDELADDTTAAVISAADRPYILFGHSMGGWMAFDVVTRIQRLGGPLPEALVASSANAPSRGLTPRDMFPAQQYTDNQLLDWLGTNGLIPQQVLSDPDLRKMALQLMRADIQVRDTFTYVDGSEVTVPLQVLTGEQDEVIVADSIEQWRALTLDAFRHDYLPGGHFYTSEIWSRLPRFIAWTW